MKGSPDKLITEFKSRSQWYCKDFGALLQGVCASIEVYPEMVREVDTSGQIEELKESFIDQIHFLLELYEALPLEESSPDYDLLSVIKENLRGLKDQVLKIINEPIKEHCEAAYTHAIIIHRNGQQFRRRLASLRDEIQQFSGLDKFTLVTTDTLGKLWKNGVL